jgi:hypothetical protein
MRSALAWIVLIVLAGGCGPVNQATRPTSTQMAGMRRLAVVVSPGSDFTVIKERRGGAATAAMVGGAFGVVGLLTAGAVHSGITASKDKDHAAAVSPHVVDVAPQKVVTEALLRTLRDGGLADIQLFEHVPDTKDTAQFDGVLRLEMPEWGLVKVSDDPDLMSGFVELKVQMAMTSGGSPIWDEAHTALGRDRLPLEIFKRDGELTRKALTETLEAAGQRLAYELLYPRGTPR